MLTDIHSHITYRAFPQFARRLLGRPGFDAEVLLRRMDLEGIDRSVVLPLSNAEVLDRYGVAGNQETLAACLEHPDRLTPFCCIDPRSMMVRHEKNKPESIFSLLTIYRDLGCRGIGELSASIPVDDPRYQVIYEAAGALEMPILFHFQPPGGHSYGATDLFHLPGLERMLAMFPKTVFIGHSMAFWSEISGEVPEAARENYLSAPYCQKGRLWTLVKKYPNLYCDISAGSGAFAIGCDPAHGPEFLNEFQDQVCFGTDRFTAEDEPIPPQFALLREYLASGKISREVYEKITHRNAEAIIRF